MERSIACPGSARPRWSRFCAEARRRRPGQRGSVVLVLLSVMVAAPLFFSSEYHYDLAILVGINAAVVISLNLLMGYAGQISLGHAGFFGIGAYAAAILTGRYGWPSPLALAAGPLLSGVLAFAIARPILRLTGYYLAMATLALGMIIFIVIETETALTGGPDGMTVPSLSAFGMTLTGGRAWYWIVATVLLLISAGALNLVDSAIGRALRALHGSELAARTAGVDVLRYKVLVFVLSATVTALMGGLFAFYSGFITPASAGFMHSVAFAVMVVLGGLGSLEGSLLAALILTLLPQLLASFAEYEWLVYGLILMLVMTRMPRGLAPTLAALIRRAAR